MATLDALRYPIGHYHPPAEITSEIISDWIDVLAALPERIDAIVTSMTNEQLNTPYRNGGWTMRQLVHHIADSHINSYIRFKWTMTESNPTIKAYDQDAWADQADSKTAAVSISVNLLAALHARWVNYLRSFSAIDFERTFYHPEMRREIRLDWLLGLYAWHCDHHLAHITGLVERERW